jgi:hypothetical protein
MVVQDIQHISTRFSEVSFKNALHEYNEAIHILARSMKHFISSIFSDFAPECRETLCNDLL